MSDIIPYVQDLMGRYVNLCSARAITWIVLCVILLILGIIGLIKMIKWATSESFDDDEICVPTTALLITVILLLLIVILCNLFGLYQNIFTPELVFLEYIKDLCGGT